MNSVAKRVLGIALSAVLAAGIVAVAVWGRGILPGAGEPSAEPSADLAVVEGVIGSEKKPFFDDPEVQAVFDEHGYDVRVTTAGSRQIATSVDLTGVDFVFPSSAPAAEKIRRETGASTVYAPFYSPMAVASFGTIAHILEDAGLAHRAAGGTWILDLDRYLDAVAAGTRWNQLPGSDAYPSSRSVLISSTDIRQSNSAAMYLAMASYVANGDNIVASQAQQDAIIDRMAALFLEQGFSASSSEAPFEDYLSQGIGSKPMVMVYEAQFLGRQMNEGEAGSITDDMVLMYPSPTVLSKHTVVPLTDAGAAIGRLLVEDPRLAALAARHGFRPADPSVFVSTLAEHGIAAPASPVDVVEAPSYETLESMITAISERYDGPAPVPSATSGTDPDQ